MAVESPPELSRDLSQNSSARSRCLHVPELISHVLTSLDACEAAAAAGVASAWRAASRLAHVRLAVTHRRAAWTWPDAVIAGGTVADVVLHTTNAGAGDIEALLQGLARGPSAGALRRMVVSRCFSIIYRRSGAGCFPRALPAFTSLHTVVLTDISDLAWPMDVVLPAVTTLALTSCSIVCLPMPAGGDAPAAVAAAAAVGWNQLGVGAEGERSSHATTLSTLLACFPAACVAFLGGVTFVAPRTFMAAHFPTARGGVGPDAAAPTTPTVVAADAGGVGGGGGGGGSSEASRSNAALHAHIFADAHTGALAGLTPAAIAARRAQYAAAVVGGVGMEHGGVPGLPHPSLQVLEVTFWPDEMQALAPCLLAPVSPSPRATPQDVNPGLASARRVVDFSRADDAIWLSQLRHGTADSPRPADGLRSSSGADAGQATPPPASGAGVSPAASTAAPAHVSTDASAPSPSAAGDGAQRRWRPQSRSAVLAHLLASANARPVAPSAPIGVAGGGVATAPSPSAAAAAVPPATGTAVATSPPPTRRTRSNPTGAARPVPTLADVVKGSDWPGVLAIATACHAPVTRSTPLHQLAYEPTGSTAAIAHAQALVGMQLRAPRDDIVRRLLNRKNARGWTPLLRAVEDGSAALVRLLVGAGASLLERNHREEPALYVAGMRGDAEVMSVLLDAAAAGGPGVQPEEGAAAVAAAALAVRVGGPVTDVVAPGRGRSTSATAAAGAGGGAVGVAGVPAGVHPLRAAFIGPDRWTALHAACVNGSAPCVELLLTRLWPAGGAGVSGRRVLPTPALPSGSAAASPTDAAATVPHADRRDARGAGVSPTAGASAVGGAGSSGEGGVVAAAAPLSPTAAAAASLFAAVCAGSGATSDVVADPAAAEAALAAAIGVTGGGSSGVAPGSPALTGVNWLAVPPFALDAPNMYRQTPLHIAARGGHADVVAALLRAGANARAKDDKGETPAMVAAAAATRAAGAVEGKAASFGRIAAMLKAAH